MRIVVLFAAFASFAAATRASEWLTFGGDPQRTGWAKTETLISPATVGKMKLGWKLKLDNAARELTALSSPVIVEGLYTPAGVKDIVIVAGSADKLFAIDADTGALMWQKQLAAEGKPLLPPDWLCANALNATPVIDRDSRTVYVIASDGKLHALNVVNGEDLFAPQQFTPPFSKPWSLNLVDGRLYASISQGCNRAKSGVYIMNLRADSRPITFFQSDTAGGGIWGRGGVSYSANTKMVYGATGDGPWDPSVGKYADTVLAVTPDGKLADYYTPENRNWLTHKDLDMGTTTPAIFPFGGRELLAATGKEGVLFLLDTAALGGADHRTPLFRSVHYTNENQLFEGRGFWGAFATQEDDTGARWLYAAAYGPAASEAPKFQQTWGDAPHGSIMAFNVVAEGKAVSLKPIWISHDMSVPDPPVVANGVLFSLSTGEDTQQVDPTGRLLTSAERMGSRASHAVLYAFDARTGKELYSSGDTITNWTHFSGLAVSNGRVYVVTHDSTIYAFSVPQ